MKEFAFDEEMSIGVDVTVHVSGYSDPGVTDGPPDNWEPPEYKEHREVRLISIGGTELPEDLVKKLAPYLQQDVDSTFVSIPELGLK